MPDSSLPSSGSGDSTAGPRASDLQEALASERRKCEQLTRDAQLSRQALEERVQFEQMLGDICSTLINVSFDELGGRIDSSLHTLVEFLGVDRSSLMEVSGDNGKMRATHSWVRPGLQAAELYEPMDAFKFYLERLRHGHMVIMSRVEDLPPEAAYEREYCLQRGIKSHVGVPLMIGGEFIGTLGFAFLRQPQRWSQDMLGRLRLIGEAFANAMLRSRWDQLQRELERSLERQVAQRTAVAERRAMQLRRLTMQLTQIAHRERTRLALVLHEGLQQVLVGAKLAIGSMAPTDLDQQTRRINALLDEAIGICRSLTVEMCPPVLYDMGLVPALRWLGSHMKDMYDLQVDMRLDAQAQPASRDLREFLFDAARELLFNVMHHSQTKSAAVVLEQDNQGQIRLSVLDRGVGFEPARLDEVTGDAFGLFSIRERLVLLGGKLHIASTPREGTCVTISVPAAAITQE